MAIILMAVLIFIGDACSTKKNRWLNRRYHNLTAHYNGYFWAREAIKDGLEKLDKSHVDDYDKILTFYRYADDKAGKANSPTWDKAIQKTSTVIAKHSMLIKGKEHCKWIDENYLVLGQGHFHKRDYYAAIEVFEYIVRQYKTTPTKYEALLWLIKTYNAQNSVINTTATIDLLENDKEFPKHLQGMFDIVRAEYYLKMENYPKAIDYLTKAIPAEKKKKQRARFTYILAQLYELQGDVKKASHYYNTCAKMTPPYELFFNARIKHAMTVSGAASKDVKKLLTKMLRDEKNREYKDQIYFALGEISLKEGDTLTAMKQLTLSAANSSANTKQRALSYLRLADLYFGNRDYKNAQLYYDSTASFLPKDHRNYQSVLNKKNSLTALIKNINIIYTEDSLLKVAAMDTAKINRIIAGIIKKLTEEEEKKKEDDKLNPNNNNTTFNNTFTNNNSQNTTGAWYFYNPSQVSFGVSDYIKKWGNRDLEDDWRRSVKEKIGVSNNDPNPNEKDTLPKDTKLADNKTPGYYLKNIPFTPDQQAKSNEKIIDAYFALGGLYKEQLADNPLAIRSLEELLKKYPGNKYELQSYYFLYRIHLTGNNKVRKKHYEELILSKYPDSEISKLIKNPDANKDANATKSEVEKFYTETYKAYTEGRYSEVISNANRADTTYSKSELMPKFSMLRAYSIGRTGTVKEYENALQRIIAKYPKDPARHKAQELLDAIKNVKIDPNAKKDTIKVVPDFVYEPNAEHYCMIMIMNKKVNANSVKTKLSDFNSEYFALANLGITSSFLDLETHIVIVKSYASAGKAMEYYQMLNGDLKVFKDMQPLDYRLMVISEGNYARLFKDKKKTEYQVFFEENYKKKP